MLSFENSTYLLGLLILVPLALLFAAVLRWKQRVRKEMGEERLVNSLTNSYSPRLYQLKFIVVLLAIVFGVLGVANLRKPKKSNDERRAGIDVIIALDVSKSMLSQDVKPSRLEKAKQCIGLLIDQLGDNRVGLVVFAGQAVLQMPLTSDVAVSKLYLSNATPDAVPLQGTDINNALQVCSSALDTKEKKYKAVVLITDGEDHNPETKKELQQLYDEGVVVYTVGIGTTEGSPIIEAGNVYKTDIDGKTVITKLNETELKEISEKTGGTYLHLNQSDETATALANELNSREKKLINGEGNDHQYASLYPFFTVLMLLILVAEIFIPEVRKRRLFEVKN